MASLYGLPARSFERHLVAGSARTCAATLARFAEAGAQHIAVFVTSDDPLVQFEDLAGEFAGLLASRSDQSTAADTLDRAGSELHRMASAPVRVDTVGSTASGTQVLDQLWR
jgi:hypothetical protein